MKPILVGEANPFGGRPGYALWPEPKNSSGDRLCRILGLTASEYLKKFERVNLCHKIWNLKLAREKAQVLSARTHTPLILLGAKVCRAFGMDYYPFSVVLNIYVLPHPSGRCHLWNEPASIPMARSVLKEFL